MRIYLLSLTKRALFCALLVLLAHHDTARGQSKSSKYACSEPNPANFCNAANTCGSASKPCSVDVKRTTEAASTTPSIPGATGNSTFCVKVGTIVVWKSETRHQGFVVDMGPTTPFDKDDIIGGSDRSVKVVAKKPGCYKYSAGACVSGEIYGMCGNSTAELIVVD
jgi:plastocyanin